MFINKIALQMKDLNISNVTNPYYPIVSDISLLLNETNHFDIDISNRFQKWAAIVCIDRSLLHCQRLSRAVIDSHAIFATREDKN